MRGGAQSHLIEASDDHCYIVKFRNNPQHHRILVNELIAAEILNYLQVAVPASELIRVGDDFLRDNPEAGIKLGSQSIAPATGWAFGSRFPGDPNLTAVYDFVPDSLIAQVQNLSDFLAILVFDKWTGNADGRQAVFLRAQLKDWFPQMKAGARKMGFIALMIDHGYILNGPHWNFVESAMQGVYARRIVYEPVTSLEDFQPWISRVENFPDEVLDRALKRIPPEWIEGEEDEVERVLEVLLRRRGRIRELLEESRGVFPNWPSRR
jgi:hypothetical protein